MTTPKHTASGLPEAVGAGTPGSLPATQPADGSDLAATQAFTASFPTGAKVEIPGYEVLEVLGRGGMGIVYKARQTQLKRLVALKMILGGGGADQVARFRREAEAVAQLQHPNIVQIYDIGDHAGHPYFSMEFVAGGGLDKHLAAMPQPPREAAALVATLAKAVHAAHCNHIVHRDLKPANILLHQVGDRRSPVSLGHPKIADFGLAKQLDSDPGQTQSGAILGTPSYMAPEQAQGQTSAVGPGVDIYALGAILYEMLTGRPPFRAGTPFDTLIQVTTSEPVPPHRLQPKVPHDLEVICLKCLDKDRRQRYDTAGALADDLDRFRRGEPIVARPSSRRERLAKWAQRRPAVAGLIAVSALAALVLLAVVLRYNTRLRHERDNADDLRGSAEWNASQAMQRAREAEAARSDALTQKGLAEERAERLRRHAYGNTMHLAYQAYEQGNIRRLLQMLEDQKPARGQPELRGFEWYYLWALCHRDLLTVQVERGQAQAVALLDGGATLLVADPRGGVKQFSCSAGAARVLPLEDDTAEARVNSFSVDGRLVARGYQDGVIKVWEVKTGKAHGRFRGSTSAILALAFSRDGRSLAAGGRDYTVRVWDLDAGKLRAEARTHRGEVVAVAFAPDGSRVVSGGTDRTARVWDAMTLEEKSVYRADPGFTSGLAFAPAGKLLAVGAGGAIALLDVDTGREIAQLPVSTLLGVRELAFAPDGQCVAASTGFGSSSEVQVWDMTTRQRLQVFKGHTADVVALALAPGGSRLATCSVDGTAKVWDVHAPPNPSLLAHTVQPVAELAFDATGQTLAVPVGKSVQIWDTATGKLRATLEGFPQLVTTAAFARDGRWLATGEGGYPAAMRDDDPALPPGEIKLWDVAQRQPRATFKGHTHGIFAVAFSPDSATLASGSWDRTVRLWDIATGRERKVLAGHSAMVRGVAFSPDGKLLAAACGDRWSNVRSEVRVWNVARGAEVAVWWHDGPVHAVAFAPDGATLAAGTVQGAIQLWDVASGKVRLALEAVPVSPINDLAFAPDGRSLASAHANGTVNLWQVSTGQEIVRLAASHRPLFAVQFSPDARALAVGDAGGSVWMYNAPRR